MSILLCHAYQHMLCSNNRNQVDSQYARMANACPSNDICFINAKRPPYHHLLLYFTLSSNIYIYIYALSQIRDWRTSIHIYLYIFFFDSFHIEPNQKCVNNKLFIFLFRYYCISHIPFTSYTPTFN